MKKMVRIAAGLAALALVAVLAGCKGKEKSNMSVEIAGYWSHSESWGYEMYVFNTDGTYEYEWSAVQAAATFGDGTYIVNTKEGKIELKRNDGYEGTLEIKGDTLVRGDGLVFTKDH